MLQKMDVGTYYGISHKAHIQIWYGMEHKLLIDIQVK